MDTATYRSQQPYAGNKQPSMKRRCVDHDYTDRRIYMVTIVVEGRRPLLGQVVGNPDHGSSSPDAPRLVPTPLGQAVSNCWYAIHDRYPAIEVVSLQLMPDHLHGILFVRSRLPRPLGQVISGFKAACNKAYRTLVLHQEPPAVAAMPQQTQPQPMPSGSAAPVNPASAPPATAPTTRLNPAPAPLNPAPAPFNPSPTASPAVVSVAALPQPSASASTPAAPPASPPRPPRSAYDRKHGLLFEAGFNDRLLTHRNQLAAWRHYLADNPRRLLMRRLHPDLFRVRFNIEVGGQTFATLGNRFLLEYPIRLQVQCTRQLSDEGIAMQVDRFMAAAHQGAVLVSPAISPGEKAVMRAAFNAHTPIIVLAENGLTPFSKPGGEWMEACSRGQLLVMTPWQHHNERTVIARSQCLKLNDMARMICENKHSET